MELHKKVEILERFKDQYCHVINIKHAFDALFSDEQAASHYFSESLVFFQDLNTVYANYLTLQMCKFLDPAVQYGNPNLTVFYIIENLFEDEQCQQELKEIIKGMINIHKELKISRHKRLAHNDLKEGCHDAYIGGYSAQQLIEYFDSLDNFVNEVNLRLLQAPFEYSPSCSGDVYDFLRIYKLGRNSDS